MEDGHTRSIWKRGLAVALSVALAATLTSSAAFAEPAAEKVANDAVVSAPSSGGDQEGGSSDPADNVAASEQDQSATADGEIPSTEEPTEEVSVSVGAASEEGGGVPSNTGGAVQDGGVDSASGADFPDEPAAASGEESADEEAEPADAVANAVSPMAAAPQARASGAESVSLGSTVSGSVGRNESRLYRVTLPSAGRLDVKGQSGFSALFRIYDESYDQLDLWYENYNSVSGQAPIDESIYLTRGTYYVEIDNYGGSSSSEAYSFTLSFSSSGTSFSEPQNGGNDTINSAYGISLGQSYKSQISLNSTQDFFKVTLGSSGRLRLTGKFYSIDTRLYVYDADGNEVYSQLNYADSVTDRYDLDTPLDLTRGTYYIAFTRIDHYGQYTFSTSFSSASESFGEEQGGSNNSLEAADAISGGTTYKGQIARNDDRDFYRFNAESQGSVTISGTAYLESVRLYVYDSNGDAILNRIYYDNDVTGRCDISESVSLSPGTYYACFTRPSYSHTGNYTFSISGSCLASSKLPAPSGLSASALSPTGVRVSWSRVSGADGYVVMRADGSGGTSFAKVGNAYSGSTTSFTDRSAAEGKTYSYSVIAFTKDGSTYTRGEWAARKVVKTAPAAPRITGASTSSSGVRLSWSRAAGADGYVVMRKSPGSSSYTKIASITSGSTLSYTDRSAASGRTYDYSVIGFVRNGGAYTRGE